MLATGRYTSFNLYPVVRTGITAAQVKTIEEGGSFRATFPSRALLKFLRTSLVVGGVTQQHRLLPVSSEMARLRRVHRMTFYGGTRVLPLFDCIAILPFAVESFVLLFDYVFLMVKNRLIWNYAVLKCTHNGLTDLQGSNER